MLCPSRANIVVQCESWWNLAKQFASRSPPLHLLCSSVQRSLMKALVLGGFAHMDSDTKQQYWTEVTTGGRTTPLRVTNYRCYTREPNGRSSFRR